MAKELHKLTEAAEATVKLAEAQKQMFASAQAHLAVSAKQPAAPEVSSSPGTERGLAENNPRTNVPVVPASMAIQMFEEGRKSAERSSGTEPSRREGPQSREYHADRDGRESCGADNTSPLNRDCESSARRASPHIRNHQDEKTHQYDFKYVSRPREIDYKKVEEPFDAHSDRHRFDESRVQTHVQVHEQQDDDHYIRSQGRYSRTPAARESRTVNYWEAPTSRGRFKHYAHRNEDAVVAGYQGEDGGTHRYTDGEDANLPQIRKRNYLPRDERAEIVHSDNSPEFVFHHHVHSTDPEAPPPYPVDTNWRKETDWCDIRRAWEPPPPPAASFGSAVNRYAYYSETCGAPLTADEADRARAEGHRVASMSEAYASRRDKLRQLMVAKLLPRRDRLASLARWVADRTDDFDRTYSRIEAETRRDSDEVLTRLRDVYNARTGELRRAAEQLRADVEHVDRLSLEVSNAAETSRPTMSMLGFVHRYSELCHQIEALAARPTPHVSDALPDTVLPRELAERLEALSTNRSFAEAVALKDETIWELNERLKAGEAKLASEKELTEEYSNEIGHWVELTRELQAELDRNRIAVESAKSLDRDMEQLAKEKEHLAAEAKQARGTIKSLQDELKRLRASSTTPTEGSCRPIIAEVDEQANTF